MEFFPGLLVILVISGLIALLAKNYWVGTLSAGAFSVAFILISHPIARLWIGGAVGIVLGLGASVTGQSIRTGQTRSAVLAGTVTLLCYELTYLYSITERVHTSTELIAAIVYAVVTAAAGGFVIWSLRRK